MPRISFKIIEIRDFPSSDPSRRGKMDMSISWLEEGARPYTIFLPLENYTPEVGIARVREEVRKHALIVGTEGEEGA